MTCREFKHRAADLTLWELSRAQDEALLRHVEGCEPCGVWLQKQRSLAASMQTLQVRTAGLEAGPDVERALLRAFRQASPRNLVLVSGGAEERAEPLRPVVVPSSTPIALRLSRWFEIGAYAAIAAAIVVGVFLGVRLLRDRSLASPVQSQSVTAGTVPVKAKPDAAAAQDAMAKPNAASPVQSSQRTMFPGKRMLPTLESGPAAAQTATPRVVPEESESNSEAGYLALMFCDPLSCSSDSEVVRMELPGSANASSQPRMADVVVGYDGVVRAVRIVN